MRIRERFMPNPARLVTSDELERMPQDDFRYELVRGRLIRMSPVSPPHGRLTMAVGARLWHHVTTHRLGEVWTEVGFRLFSNPDTVLAPDVAFVGSDRLPSRDARGFYRGAPDLAIEVRSPDDADSEIHDKVGDYLAAGTPMVVVIDPAAREVSVHRPGTSPEICGPADTLDLHPIVRRFSVTVEALFE